jgi:hypothetical protein
MSVQFGGMFGYIPDPTNLGTTFVNAISNILTTSAIDVKINISQEIIQNILTIEAGEFIESKIGLGLENNVI